MTVSRHLVECVAAGIPVKDGKLQRHPYQRDRHSGAGNCVCARHEGHQIHVANAEQAKSTGGMVALIPRQQDAELLAVDGGEPVDDLHLTVVYLGEDVTDQDPTELVDHLVQIHGDYPAFKAKVFGIGQFNPQGDEPCVVYLVGENPDLSPLYRDLKEFVARRYPGAAEQHEPYIPHITAGYGLSPEDVTYQGPVVFDQLALHWAGKVKRFPL